ncbi:hypothetical protein Tco_0411137 [Tanacetum coccineum]
MDSIISLGQKNTLAEYMILSGADNRPPMLDKDLAIRIKKYAELSAAEKIQADCDMNATNIILQGLPADIYSLVNHQRVAKDLWERVQLLMQGTSLTKRERECKLCDAFDKFTHIKGESLHTYYLRFTQLINDMNIYKMKIEQFQVNTKFLNSLPPEWSKFVADVKLVKVLHTSNFDQLHSYLEQHKLHANKVRIMRERNQDPLAFVVNQQMTPPHFNTYHNLLHNNPQRSNNACFAVPVFSPGDNLIACVNKAMAFLMAVASSRAMLLVQGEIQGQARVVKCYNCQDLGIPADQAQTIIPHNAAFQTEDLDTYDSNCDDLSTAQAVLMANISNYGSNIISEVPNSETYLNDMDNQSVHALQDFEQTPVMDFTDNEISSDSNIIPYSQYLQETQQATVQDTNLQAQQDSMILSVIKQMSEQMINHTVHMLTKLQAFCDNTHKQALGYQNPFYLKKAQRIKPTLYDGVVISNTHVAMPVIDDEETLILEEESR